MEFSDVYDMFYPQLITLLKIVQVEVWHAMEKNFLES